MSDLLKYLETSSNTEKMLNDFAQCLICCEVFTEPKALKCLHRFCEACLRSYITATDKEKIKRDKGFTCPICREITPSPNPNRPVREWASLLRTDFHMKNLIAFIEANNVQREETVIQPCGELHTRKERQFYCADCAQVICSTCSENFHIECSFIMSLQEAAADQRANAEHWLREIHPKFKEADNLENEREKHFDTLASQVMGVKKAISAHAESLRQLVTDAESKLLGELERDYELLHHKLALDTIHVHDRLLRYKGKRHALLSLIPSTKSDFDLMTHDVVIEGFRDFPVTGLDTGSFRTWVAGLASVTSNFEKAALPSINLGTVSFTKPPRIHMPDC